MVEHPPLTPFGSALAGALGAVFSNAVVYPLDTVKTRLQALPTDQLGEKNILPANTDGRPSATKGRGLIGRLRRWEMLQMLIRIIKSEGISGAFKGFTANMLNTFSMQFAYFFFHTLLRSNLIKHIASRQPTRAAASLSTSSELLVGAAAGALAQIFTIPVSVIATRQQLWIPPAKGSTGASASVREPSLVETAHEIISEGGVTALWTGLKPGLVLTVNPAITYGAFERLKSAVLDKPGRVEKKLGALEAFAIGVGSKAIATVVTYPYIFAKVRLQAKRKKVESAAAATESQEPTSTGEKHGHDETYAEVAAHEPSDPSAVISSTPPVRSTSKGPPVTAREIQHTGAIPLLAAVYKKQGLAGWYKGLTAQLIKAVLCQGILFVSKDQFEVWAWLILSSFAKIRQRVAVKV